MAFIATQRSHAAWARSRAAALVPVLTLLFAACYNYVPVDFASPQQGQLIRAELSSEGEQAVIPVFGPGVREIRGMTLENTSTDISVLAESLQSRQGVINLDPQPVRLTPAQVTGIYERRLSRGKSALLAVGIGAATFLLVDSFADLGRIFDTEGEEPPGPPSLRIPISIPIGR